MHIFKFGGASVKDAEGVKNLFRIISAHGFENLVVVVSAMGKTTNKLEEVAKKTVNGEEYSKDLDELNKFHRSIAAELFDTIPERYESFEKSLRDTAARVKGLDSLLAYDQIVPHGELMSTALISAYLNEKRTGCCEWFDARTVIRTDQYFTEANVDWVVTEKQIQQSLKPLVTKKLIITQGFIGSDMEGNSTTLGREGSDYTGAILAYGLNADSFTVWKDVPGILNADPRILSDTRQYENLSYREVTEMTYYGAQVIHPKTLKPIAQKSIPLIVRSFQDIEKNGTTISATQSSAAIPCFVFKGNQLLVTAQVKDHSFMDEKKLGTILQVLDLLNIKINLMQNSALTFSFCIDNKEFKSKRIKELLNRDFILSFKSPLSLATIKNYTPDSFNKLPWNRSVIMEQKTMDNYQVLYR
ncbi:MAG: aspartate kinase [Ekhidna sp.]